MLATVVLVLRNLALVAFLVWLAALVWRMLRSGRSGEALHTETPSVTHDENERKVGP
jgi:hypothetical protein